MSVSLGLSVYQYYLQDVQPQGSRNVIKAFQPAKTVEFSDFIPQAVFCDSLGLSLTGLISCTERHIATSGTFKLEAEAGGSHVRAQLRQLSTYLKTLCGNVKRAGGIEFNTKALGSSPSIVEKK